MTQYYVMELMRCSDGTFLDVKHVIRDEDPGKALMKAESKYYGILSAAAVSGLPVHAAIMFTSDGVPVLHRKYSHTKERQTQNHVGGKIEPQGEEP